MMSFFRRGEAKEVDAKAETFKIFGWWFLALVGLLFYLYADKALNLYPLPIPKNEGLWETWLSDTKGYSFSDYLWKNWYYFLFGIFTVALLSYACFRFFRQSILTIQMLLPFFVLFFTFLTYMGPPHLLLIYMYFLDSMYFLAFWFLFPFFIMWRINVRYPDLRQEQLRQSPTINARAEAFMLFVWLLLGLVFIFIYLYVSESLRLYPFPDNRELREDWVSDIKSYNFSHYLREYWYYGLFGVFAVVLFSHICFRYCQPHNLAGLPMGVSIFMLLAIILSVKWEPTQILYTYSTHNDFFIVTLYLFYVFFWGWTSVFGKVDGEKYRAYRLGITVEQMDKFDELWKPKIDSDKKKLIADELDISIEKIDELDEVWTKKDLLEQKDKQYTWKIRVGYLAIIMGFVFFIGYVNS